MFKKSLLKLFLVSFMWQSSEASSKFSTSEQMMNILRNKAIVWKNVFKNTFAEAWPSLWLLDLLFSAV